MTTSKTKKLIKYAFVTALLAFAVITASLISPFASYAETASVQLPSKPSFTPQEFKEYTDEMFYISDSFTSSENCTLPYRAHKPFNSSGAMPLVVYLHGRGERGTDNEKQFTYWPYLSENSKFHDAYIVAPQCPVKSFDNGWVDYFTYEGQKAEEGYTSETFKVDNIKESAECRAVLELIEQICQNNEIDRNRIYLIGFSQGAVATWDLIARHSDIFAAAVPVSGIGDLSKAEVYAEMPIYAFHGEEDETVTFSTGTKAMYDAINAVGKNKMHFASFKGGDHAFSGQVALLFGGENGLPALEDWLFSQTKQKPEKSGCNGSVGINGIALIGVTMSALALGIVLMRGARRKVN